MAKVLRTTPSVTNIVVGAEMRRNSGDWDGEPRQAWFLPYVEYSAPDGAGNRMTLSFLADRHHDGKDVYYEFMAILPGLSAPNEEPSDWGTTKLVARWYADCGVKAFALYE
ncbi:MAG TPA: hypothetical protein VJ476_13305 [Rhizomicrobium sp.]|nr:hypothetical protein [Rhizomicrobium sp.]